jgi:hypothetical protein
MAKYDPLRDYLTNCGADRVALSFSQIGKIVGGLPPTAEKKDEWWANEDVRSTRHTQCKSWQLAGYRASVDRRGKMATFDRIEV